MGETSIAEALRTEGVDTTDARALLRAALGVTDAHLAAHPGQRLTDGERGRFVDWVRRRRAGEPVAYLTGEREFWSLTFKVTPAVLIPRPETESIVDEGVALGRALPSPRMADIGTGSGCIAVALALELPSARFVATDVSEDALVVARTNAQRHRVADRIEFVATSYLDGVEGRFDVITANPPYVRDGDKPGLSRDVRHEPDVALFGGTEGLRDIAGVLAAASDALVPGGWLVMEFGYGQEPGVEALVNRQTALRLHRVQPDLQGIPRTAIIQRR
jgi:release factor glutamine methyltransferase